MCIIKVTAPGPKSIVRGPKSVVRGPKCVVRGPKTIVKCYNSTPWANYDNISLENNVQGHQILIQCMLSIIITLYDGF